jgi:hypothetical protein
MGEITYLCFHRTVLLEDSRDERGSEEEEKEGSLQPLIRGQSGLNGGANLKPEGYGGQKCRFSCLLIQDSPY